MTIDIEKLIEDLDEDGSGEIEYDEFKALLETADWSNLQKNNAQNIHILNIETFALSIHSIISLNEITKSSKLFSEFKVNLLKDNIRIKK